MLRPLSLRRCLLALAAAAALTPAATAHAGVFPGEVVDGPSPDLLSVGGADVNAGDGTGGVAYLRADGGVPHVFVAPILDGIWQRPERVDVPFAAAASEPVIAAGRGGRLVVGWIADTTLYVSIKPAAGAPWGAPQAVGGPAALPAIDMGYNDNAYLVWSTNGDVLAARLPRGATAFQPVDGPLDLDAARVAGDRPSLRPSVAVSAEGLALVAWGEIFPDGRTHVVARRVNGTQLSPVPQDLTLDQLDGRPGGDADWPMATIQMDSSFGWVGFRQAFAEGGGMRWRGLARHMRGSAFEPPVVIDGQTWPGEDVGPLSIAINGGGTGFAAVPRASGALFGDTVNRDDVWAPIATRLDSAPMPLASRPPVVYTEDKTGLVAWPAPDGGLRMRTLTGIEFQPEQQITKPELGPVDVAAGVVAAGDRYLDAAVVAMQGAGAERRLTAAMLVRAPGGFSPHSSSRWFKGVPARLSWREPIHTWGRLTYTVEIDGKPVGQTRKLSYPTAGLGLTGGTHLWRVVATDARGQASVTPTRFLKVDPDPPNVTITFSGSRRHGRVTTIKVRAIDTASGSETPVVDLGDGVRVTGRTIRHAYPRRGRFTVRVTARDKAGNVTTASRRVSIR